jgi:transposase-like protein
VAAIARRLGLSVSAVRYRLRRAGLDPAARLAAERRRFVAAWQAAPDLAALARAVGMTALAARQRASYLRSTGVPLKRMPQPWPRPGTRTAAVVRLCRRGVPPAAVARRLGVCRHLVYQVLRRLRAAGVPAAPGRRGAGRATPGQHRRA